MAKGLALLEVSAGSAYKSLWAFKPQILLETKIHSSLHLDTFKNLPHGKYIFSESCSTVKQHSYILNLFYSMQACLHLRHWECFVICPHALFWFFLIIKPWYCLPWAPKPGYRSPREQGMAGRSGGLLLGCRGWEVQGLQQLLHTKSHSVSAFPISAPTPACSLAL